MKSNMHRLKLIHLIFQLSPMVLIFFEIGFFKGNSNWGFRAITNSPLIAKVLFFLVLIVVLVLNIHMFVLLKKTKKSYKKIYAIYIIVFLSALFSCYIVFLLEESWFYLISLVLSILATFKSKSISDIIGISL